MINEISQNCAAARRRMGGAERETERESEEERKIERPTDRPTCRPANKIKCTSKKTTQNEMNESKISSVRKNLISSVRLCLMSKRTAYTIISFN